MPPKGNINLTMYSADRTLWSHGKVRLQVVDPFSDTQKLMAEDTVQGPTVLLENVLADKGRLHAILASAPGYRDAGIYPIKARANGLVQAAVMLMPEKAGFGFPRPLLPRLKSYSPLFWTALVEGGITESDLLEEVEPERVACALNIEAKLRNTRVLETPAMEFVRAIEGLGGIRHDCIRAKVHKTMMDKLRIDTESGGSFEALPEKKGAFPISFKQRVPFGSLRLSFSEKEDGELLEAEIDIHLWADLEHFGKYMRGVISRQTVDSFNVYRHLFDQRIFPHYLVHDTTRQ
jgi:hypothetical protein